MWDETNKHYLLNINNDEVIVDIHGNMATTVRDYDPDREDD